MRKVIYVVSHGTQWKVQCDHCTSQTTSTKDEAIKLAKRHVGDLKPGELSQIRIQGNGGQWLDEWTYGKDPFPPRG